MSTQGLGAPIDTSEAPIDTAKSVDVSAQLTEVEVETVSYLVRIMYHALTLNIAGR